MNKYQEALDFIKLKLEHLKYEAGKAKQVAPFIPSEYFATLQELIDNYEKSLRLCVMETKEKIIVEKALDMACELNIKQRFDRDYPYIPNDVIKQKEKELKEDLIKLKIFQDTQSDEVLVGIDCEDNLNEMFNLSNWNIQLKANRKIVHNEKVKDFAKRMLKESEKE